jgi:hypothetical protein
VPAVCIPAIQADGALDLMSDQLCPIYLILSSPQYQSFQKSQRQAFVDGLKTQLQNGVTNPVKRQSIINGVLAAYKILSQQEGANSGTSGTTNLVAKGAASELLSLASEYGL